MNDQEILLESQIRELYGRVIYTHKTHEKCADILKSRYDNLKIAEIVLSVLTTSSILLLIFGKGIFFQIAAALISAILTGLTLYTKDNNLLELVEKHKQSALNILEIREKLLSLLVDIKIGNKNLIDLQLERDVLNEQLVNYYRGAPKTSEDAFMMASKALKEKEEFTFSDNEIDKFLTESLKRTN